MKDYHNNDYAANKYADGIVYLFADGAVEITLEDYLRDNPGKTAADFRELKLLSDAIYRQQDREATRQSNKNVPLHGLEETKAVGTPSPENLLFDLPEQAERDSQRRQLAELALDALTETQRRRFVQYHGEGLSLREIADKERKNFKSIDESVRAGETKIKKYLSEA